MHFQFEGNHKQGEFLLSGARALSGENEYRHLFYGGAIRGGKTWVSLAILVFAAMKYPGSRWHVFRRDMPALLSTTIPSMEKLLAGDPEWRWHRHPADYYVEHTHTRGRIYFRGEGLARDPELNDLLGLETNGILFEQIEELSEKLWQTGLSRIGSWLIPMMPKPITLATFNPTQTWVKERIYEPHRCGTLAAPFLFVEALPTDNPYVTAEQWQAWLQLESRYRQQYIEGDWTDFGAEEGRWAFAFEEEKHVARLEMPPDRMHTLYLSFDFNRNPICCSVIQCIGGQIRVIETIKLADSNVYALCSYIIAHYGDFVFMVTGDCSGYSRSALVQDNVNYYTVIKSQLRLTNNQMQVPKANPRLEDNQVLVNSLLARYDVRINANKARALLYDLRNVKMAADGSIIKTDRTNPAQQADALDTFRYYCNVFHSNALRSIYN